MSRLDLRVMQQRLIGSRMQRFSALTWVGDHHQDAVGAVLDNVGDDELEDVDVALHQVEAALALLLAGAGSHHHHSGISRHTVVCGNISSRG